MTIFQVFEVPLGVLRTLGQQVLMIVFRHSNGFLQFDIEVSILMKSALLYPKNKTVILLISCGEKPVYNCTSILRIKLTFYRVDSKPFLLL